MKMLIIIIIALALSSCSRGNWYYSQTRKHGIEKYHTLRPGWPRANNCYAYYSNQPVKESAVRKQFFWRRTRN